MAKVDWDFGGHFFDRFFTVKQLLEQSSDLDAFFIAGSPESATAMLVYR